MASLQAPGEGARFVVISAEPHHLARPTIHNVEEVTARWLHYHSEVGHGFRPTNQPVEVGRGDTGALTQTVDDVAA
jgi:hypothetical protein